MELELAVIGVTMSYDHEPARAHAAAAVAHAEESGDGGLVALALAVQTLVEFLLGAGLDDARLARALELEEEDRQMQLEARPSMLAGVLALFTGRIDQAAGLLYPLRLRLLERGEDADLPLLSIQLSWLELAIGRTEAARALWTKRSSSRRSRGR